MDRPGVAGGLFQRLDLDGVAVRLVQQLVQARLELLRQPKRGQLLQVARLLQRLLALALDARERGLERIGRRGLVASLALSVEVHRRAVQAQQQAPQTPPGWALGRSSRVPASS